MAETKIEFLFRMMANNATLTESGGTACQDIEVDLTTDHVEDEDNVEVLPKDSPQPSR